SFHQGQLATSLRDLSNSVSVLGGMIADLKVRSGRQDYKAEVERQLAGVTTSVAGLTNALLEFKPTAMEMEMKDNLAFVKSRLASARAQPVWFDYALLGLLTVSLGLSGWVLATSRGQLAFLKHKTRETRELLLRFGAQMEGRVKSMEGSSVAVQNSAHEVNDFLNRVESMVHKQFETIAQQLNSTQVNELARGAASTAEQMARVRSETVELQKFIGGLHQSTQRWVADFEKQTGRTLEKIKDDMHALENLLWPAPFRDGKLGESRERIRERATAGDKSALALVLGMGELQLALASRDGNTAPMVQALDRLGLLAYRFWKGEPGASVESTFEHAQEWGSEINKFLGEKGVPLRVRIIMPRAGFDMATMLPEHSATGTTTRVREPLSWVIVAKDDEQPSRVLVTGKVITE
ncbi:MAG TPA: hypothetical protein VFB72_05355, partial [Verrucomicrobiae bacterium]|nr:hypothetical protein [Verrucomicrobiae bacterium]